MADDDLHLARLSIDDLYQAASTSRTLAQKGDKAAVAVAKALVSVVAARRQRAASITRIRKLTAVSSASPALP